MRKIDHFGIPTKEKHENAVFLEPLNLWVTDYSKSPNRIEFLRFEEGSCMDKLIQNIPHLAYEVPCMEDAIKGAKVIFEPLDCGGEKTIAFIEEEGIPVELVCYAR